MRPLPPPRPHCHCAPDDPGLHPDPTEFWRSLPLQTAVRHTSSNSSYIPVCTFAVAPYTLYL